MLTFFRQIKCSTTKANNKPSTDGVIAVESIQPLNAVDIERLKWLFGCCEVVTELPIKGKFIGPRVEMITPWSTNAVEIAQNMGVNGITRIERFKPIHKVKGQYPSVDKMLERVYNTLNDNTLSVTRKPEEIIYIDDLETYNLTEGLALSADEINYLKLLSQRINRPLTDSEVFGFSQVNSEHCRHKIFNGRFIIDGEEMPESLFKLIKKTSKENPRGLVSAYKDNVAFIDGPNIEQFAPRNPNKPDSFDVTDIETVISLKAETHNFPTTVEPFNGAATGSGGEIRDRLGGGRASLPLAGTAVYITSYPRTGGASPQYETTMEPRPWLYQTPEEILIKASNGASDFGNKFGQPLICGSLLTFELEEKGRKLAYDKVIMLAGGVGYANRRDAIKGIPQPGQKVVLLGGDNYRIGMGGGAVSSVNTGQYGNAIELNAVQRANPEMQKRVSNVIRALAECSDNPIVSIHDHGAGGHLNALSELVESTGGKIEIASLPVGDPTLSSKEIIGNESQERMGLVVDETDTERIRQIAERERAPFYIVGETTDDHRFVFEQVDGVRPIDLAMSDMFGSSPVTVMVDKSIAHSYSDASFSPEKITEYLRKVLSLEAVACKDWLTNKVDRSVTGRVAHQQCLGELQLPLADCGIVALDYTGTCGIATSIGHAPQAALIDPAAGSILSIAEALTNIAGSNLKNGLESVSLSANWMWPCRNEGEDAALYRAVKACSDFACALGVNIPTGKDSLSMTQTYPDGQRVIAPGTVIISAAGEVANINATVSPVMVNTPSDFLYIDFSGSKFELGGSALFQALGKIGSTAPAIKSPQYFAQAFTAVQSLVAKGQLLAAHDVSAGGLITTLLEMTFSNTEGGIDLDTSCWDDDDIIRILFSENPAIVVQIDPHLTKEVKDTLTKAEVNFKVIGSSNKSRSLNVFHHSKVYMFSIDDMRDVWYKPSFMLDCKQTLPSLAGERMTHYGHQPIRYKLPKNFTGSASSYGISGSRHCPSGVKAAIIREKGVNGDREMAYSLYYAGFDVVDVTMTDLISGRETLEDVNMIVFCGGFSNSDVLGSAKGWAGAFKWNKQAAEALKRFYARNDTLSLGICNGCQLMIELGLIRPNSTAQNSDSTEPKQIKMSHNDSGKFESRFLDVTINPNNTVMLGTLAGSRLGIWVAHGEGKFTFPANKVQDYNIVAKYSYSSYPGNPNGSARSAAAVASPDGRHIAMMPHLERAIFPWQCAYYPLNRLNDDVTPWIEAFVNAYRWIQSH